MQKKTAAECDIPSCLPAGESTTECKLLIKRIFKHNDCSNNAYRDGGIRYAHVSKHIEDPTIPQTDVQVYKLFTSMFNPSHLTLNDNYYYNQLYSGNFVPILKETYTEAKNTGVVAFNHWIVSQEHLKYSIFEYDFASDCPDGRYSGYYLRKKYPWLRHEDKNQEIVKYWQRQIAARSTVKYVYTERETHIEPTKPTTTTCKLIAHVVYHLGLSNDTGKTAMRNRCKFRISS